MVSRRSFVRSLGAGAAAAAWIGGRGWEAEAFGGSAGSLDPGTILLNSNENPVGPGAAVLGAVRTALGTSGDRAGRYPFFQFFDLADVVAKVHGISSGNVFVGCGSTQLLRTTTDLFTSESRPLVQPAPTYEVCKRHADAVGTPTREVGLDSSFGIDLGALAAASNGAGLVYLCNPNNPTGTVHSASDVRELVSRVKASSPETTVLVDEAYFDYVSLPTHESLIPLAAEDPNVLVTRTFSKAYGMAGLRIGYVVGHPETIRKIMGREGFELYTNLPAIAGANAALGQGNGFLEQERKRNEEVRTFTRSFFEGQGVRATDSQANFLFLDPGMSAEAFQSACAQEGVLVGRTFPPLTDHARVSLGTMDEMKRATEAFARVLARRVRAA
jgi:histidinol-phosphate aminotransferase